MPKIMDNHGNFVVSLGLVCKWLAEKAGHRINEDKRQKSQPDQQA